MCHPSQFTAHTEPCLSPNILSGMALLLRKVLQMFAGCSLLDIQPGGQGRPGVMDAFLEADEEQWTSMLQDMAGKQGSR